MIIFIHIKKYAFIERPIFGHSILYGELVAVVKYVYQYNVPYCVYMYTWL